MKKRIKSAYLPPLKNPSASCASSSDAFSGKVLIKDIFATLWGEEGGEV
jgi:hypothetical protein